MLLRATTNERSSVGAAQACPACKFQVVSSASSVAAFGRNRARVPVYLFAQPRPAHQSQASRCDQALRSAEKGQEGAEEPAQLLSPKESRLWKRILQARGTKPHKDTFDL
jgi:hypothetical protein